MFSSISNFACIDVRVLHNFLALNECDSPSRCHGNASCTDTFGSFFCTCDLGFVGDGFNCSSKLTLFNEGYWNVYTSTCIDIDECSNSALNNCGIGASCIDTIGSFQCSCNGGYMDNGNGCEGKEALKGSGNNRSD